MVHFVSRFNYHIQSHCTLPLMSSFKDKYRAPSDMPPAEMEGMLERKQELQSGGKKATIRSWKHYYTVLCGQLLCFFKDRQGRLRFVLW